MEKRETGRRATFDWKALVYVTRGDRRETIALVGCPREFRLRRFWKVGSKAVHRLCTLPHRSH